jgi:dCTP deaminase
MVLSDVDIHRYLDQGQIKITPALPPEQFGSCSVDFRLGDEFSVFEHSRHAFIDLKDSTAIQDLMRTIRVTPGEPFILQPREFALAITEETLELDDDVLGRLEGRSSLGRIGIIVHGTAGLFDPGWTGKATLELRCPWRSTPACESVPSPSNSSPHRWQCRTGRRPGTNTRVRIVHWRANWQVRPADNPSLIASSGKY